MAIELPPPVVIAAPPLLPPRVSLVTAAGSNAATNAVDADGRPLGERWLNGVTFAPETCSDAGGWWDCYDENAAPTPYVPPDDKTIDEPTANPDVVAFHPWFVWHGDRCTGLQWRTRGGRDRAVRALLARESKQIADEFWHGTIATAAGLPNRFLMDSNLVQLEGGNAQPYLMALTLLQRELALCSPGRGMIHASHQLATLWQSEHAVERDGDVLLDLYGNIVVVDAGYDGAGPDVAAPVDSASQYQWAYATDVVSVWRGDVAEYGDPEGDAFGIDDNTVQWIVERPAMVTFSPCCQLGVKVDLDDACGPYDPFIVA